MDEPDEREASRSAHPLAAQPPDDQSPDDGHGQQAADPGQDPDYDAYLAWAEREIAEGRERVPEPWETQGPAVSLSLGDAADLDPALLAAVCGPDGLDAVALGPQFRQDGAADALRPGPVLSALTEQAISEVCRLTDDQLSGALQAARRLENRAFYLQTLAVAEFARRRAALLADADARKVRPGRRPGEHPDAELAAEMLLPRGEAGNLIAMAEALTSRLPRTLAAMSAGLVDASRAAAIAFYTASLGPEDAAEADEILASAAPEVRSDTLARRAAALEMRLDPEAARDRKEHARQTRQRVEVRRELSGNAALCGRELATADAMASQANIHALALRLRRAGLPGTLDALRTRVFNDLLQGRDPLGPAAARGGLSGSEPGSEGTGIRRTGSEGADGPGGAAGGSGPGPAGTGTGGTGISGDDEETREDREGDMAGPAAFAAAGPGPAPMPALINLLVPVGTLLGWGTAPAQAAGWGLLDPEDTSAIVQAASQHPATRWCMTVIGPDGTAIAHGCAAGQHPWTPDAPQEHGDRAAPGTAARSAPARQPDPRQPGSGPRNPESPRRPRPPQNSGGRDPGPPRRDQAVSGTWQAARFASLVRRLNVALTPIARGGCDHAEAESRYTPSRKLRHLVRARSATCTFPGCQAQALYADLDHTVPHPAGATCQCNLGPKCRTHHRCKQAPGWNVAQPEPGVFRWTLPSGRVYITRPTAYIA